MSEYPLPQFHFQVEWGGQRLGFSEVSGLNIEVQVIEYRDGLSPDYSAIKMPGIKKYSNITLKRGIVFALDLKLLSTLFLMMACFTFPLRI